MEVPDTDECSFYYRGKSHRCPLDSLNALYNRLGRAVELEE